MINQSIVKEAVYKDWVLNNTIVKKYCEENNLDLKKLYQMKADYLPDRIVFFKPTNIAPIGLLDNDIETQPKAVFGVVVSVKEGKISVLKCESTEYTKYIKA